MSGDDWQVVEDALRPDSSVAHFDAALAVLTRLREREAFLEKEILTAKEIIANAVAQREAAEARVAELEEALLKAREAPGGPQDRRVVHLEKALREIASEPSGKQPASTLEGWTEADARMRTIARGALTHEDS